MRTASSQETEKEYVRKRMNKDVRKCVRKLSGNWKVCLKMCGVEYPSCPICPKAMRRKIEAAPIVIPW